MSLEYEPSSEPLHISAEQFIRSAYLTGGPDWYRDTNHSTLPDILQGRIRPSGRVNLKSEIGRVGRPI